MTTSRKKKSTEAVAGEPKDDSNVGTVHAAASTMREAARLPRALRGGTQAMRTMVDFTPKSPGESQEAYELRLKRSFLFGAYEDISEKTCAHVFSGGVQVLPPDVALEQADNRKQSEGKAEPEKAKLDDQVQAWTDDIDLQGSSLEEFLLAAWVEGIDCGVVHALVDHVGVPGAPNLEAEIKGGARPYATLFAGDALIQVEFKRESGKERLTRVHVEGTKRVTVGAYGEAFRRQVTVYTAGDSSAVDDASEISLRWCRWERFVADDEDKLPTAPNETGTMQPHVDIPIASWYLRKSGFMTGRPALLRIAEKCAEHWQSGSHQRYNLDFARFAQLFRKGFDDAPTVKVGGAIVHEARREWADMKVVETSGAALGAGRQHLEDCKAELQVLALEPFLKLNAVTATETAVQKDEADNKVGAWAKGAERFAQKILDLAMAWRTRPGAEAKSPGKVTIAPSQKLVLSQPQFDFLKWLGEKGHLQQKTLLRYGKEMGLLPDWLDIDLEVEATKNERPAMIGDPLALLRGGVPPVPPVPPKPDPDAEPPADE